MKTFNYRLLASVSILIVNLLCGCRRETSLHCFVGMRSSELAPPEFIKHVSRVLQENGYAVQLATDTRYYVASASNYIASVSFHSNRLSGDVMIEWLTWEATHNYSIQYSLNAKDNVQAVRTFLDDLFSQEKLHRTINP